MFTQAVGMTASDWSASTLCCQMRQNKHLNLALSFTKIAVSVLILRLKPNCLLKNCAVYGRIYVEFQLLQFFWAQILQ